MSHDRKSSLFRTVSMISLAGAAWLALAGIAAAADGAKSAADAAKPAATEEGTVIVTAGRREQALQKVPTAVSAVTTERLEKAGIQYFADIANVTPSLNITEGGGVRYINMRGIGIAVSTPFQTAGVPLHVDGLYIPNSGFFGRDPFFDLDGVEVYRGPQGTFAGQNSTGGAIFLRTKAPQFDDFGFQLQQLVGNYQWLQTQGWLNMPINEHVAARLSFDTETRHSFFTNLGPGNTGVGASPNYAAINRPGNLNRQVLRGQIRVAPNDRLDVKFKADLTHDYTDGNANVRAAPLSFNDPTKLINPWRFNLDVPQSAKLDLYRGTLNVLYHATNWFDVKLVGGGQYYRNLTLTDTDGTSPFLTPVYAPGPINQSISHFKTADNYWFGEMDLVSTSAGKLHWIAGATGFKQTTEQFSETSSYALNNCGAGCTSWLNGPLTGSWLDYHQKGNSWAVFGEATYDFNEHFQLIAGGRWTYYQINLVSPTTILNAAVNAQGGHDVVTSSCANTPCNVFGTGTYDRFTGRVAMNWFPTSDITVYATFSQGMKPGSFNSQFTLGQPTVVNGQPSPANPPQYNSETLRNYEGGFKTRLLNHHLVLNLDGFYNDYRDYQASFAIPGAGPIPRSVNIPKARTYGVEFETHLSEGDFRVDVTAAYLNSKILNGLPAGSTGLNVTSNYYAINCPNAVQFYALCPAGAIPAGINTYVPTTGAKAPVFDPTGEELNFAPQWTVNGAIEYDIHLPTGILTPRIQYQYVGSQWASLYHASQDFQPSHHTVDLRLTYQAPEHWRVEGFVTNLTDELYVSGVLPAAPTVTCVGPPTCTAPPGVVTNASVGSIGLGAPRQFGMRIQYTY